MAEETREELLTRLARDYGDPVALERVAALIETHLRVERATKAELAKLVRDADDWRTAWYAVDRERMNLKFRLTGIRRAFKLRSSVGNVTAKEVLDDDDAKRRRFERRERARRK